MLSASALTVSVDKRERRSTGVLYSLRLQRNVVLQKSVFLQQVFHFQQVFPKVRRHKSSLKMGAKKFRVRKTISR